jgi:UDP-glucuronate 4-epimerase
MTPILVTGAAGFIGYHLAERLLGEGKRVVGLDNLSDYYDVRLKRARLARLAAQPNFTFAELDLADGTALGALFAQYRFKRVFNLAAQAGVRYSLVNPQAYIHSNVAGFTALLEACRHHKVEHLVFASSSSVYGAVTKTPFSVHQNVDHPLNVYAATKKANELLAHTYSHLYALPTTGLRFFTVYGPWGRPDMAAFLFTKAILAGEPINVFGEGEMERDFTYIDDIVEGVARAMDRVPTPDPNWSGHRPDPATSNAPYRLYNIGNHTPMKVNRLIEIIERCTGKKAIRNEMPVQPGEVPATFADVDDLARDVGFAPKTPLDVGMKKFIDWYRDFYGV